jgi:hypothetical protein
MLNRRFPASLLAAALLCAAAPSRAETPDTAHLEAALIQALQIKPGTHERASDSGEAIQGYVKAGLVGHGPNRRFDYTDYWLLKQPATFMGHELLVIEEEYPSKFIGCCPSEGAGVDLRVMGSTDALEAFAEAHGCQLDSPYDLPGQLRQIGLKATLPKGQYASLSCRERDLPR